MGPPDRWHIEMLGTSLLLVGVFQTFKSSVGIRMTAGTAYE
jgi:hypothetical protein